MSVYFIRATGGFGPVKIGFSDLPATRLYNLMAYAPYPLEIVAEVPGGSEMEMRFHALFREQHSHREWFHPHPALERVIEQLRAGTFDFAALPPGKRLPQSTRGPWSTLQREALALGALVRHRCEKHGIRAPTSIVNRIATYVDLSEEDRAELKCDVEVLLADPANVGSPIEAPWAKAAFARFIAMRRAA